MQEVFHWTDKQKELIDLVTRKIQEPAETVNVFAHGGIGSGKSVTILFLIDFICRHTPGITFLVTRRSFESLKLDTFNILDRNPGILDASKGKWANSHKDFVYHNGSIIYFRHMEKSDSLLGPTYGGIYVEQIELCAEEDFKLLRGRLRQYSESNPYHTKYKEFVDKHQMLPARNYMLLAANPKANWVQSNIIRNDKTEFTLISMPTYSNAKNLPKGYINDNESDAFKRRMYEGRWESLAGLCYPEFTAGNLIDDQDPIELRYFSKERNCLDFSKLQTFIIVDPGIATSKTAVMFAAVLPDQRLYIFDEISRNGKQAALEGRELALLPEIAEEIHRKIKKYNIADYYGIIDYAANSQNIGMQSITQQFRDQNLFLNYSIKTHEFDSIMKINSLFKQKKLLVNVRCSATLMELDLFSWKTDKNGNPNKDEPKNENNDFMDCMRYFVNASPIAEAERIAKKSWTDAEVQSSYMTFLFSEEREKNPVLTHKRHAGLDFGT